MSTCNRSHRFMLRAIDPSKTETSFHLLISNLGWITFLEKKLWNIASPCRLETERKAYHHFRHSTGTITNNH
jgi:hypothetical protein